MVQGYTLPFVSVAPTLEKCPEALRGMHVGALEEGTAVCLELMNAARLEGGFGERSSMPRVSTSTSTTTVTTSGASGGTTTTTTTTTTKASAL